MKFRIPCKVVVKSIPNGFAGRNLIAVMFLHNPPQIKDDKAINVNTGYPLNHYVCFDPSSGETRILEEENLELDNE